MEYIPYYYKKYPQQYFEKSPVFSHKYFRFEEIARQGSQKQLWTILNNTVRDWYWFLCREFDLKAYPIDTYFFPLKVLSFGDAYENIHRENGKEFIIRHIIRINLNAIRHVPELFYFQVIPHEVCHAIADNVYWEDDTRPFHDSRWADFMEYIGLEPDPYIHPAENDQKIIYRGFEQTPENLCQNHRNDINKEIP